MSIYRLEYGDEWESDTYGFFDSEAVAKLYAEWVAKMPLDWKNGFARIDSIFQCTVHEIHIQGIDEVIREIEESNHNVPETKRILEALKKLKEQS